MPQVTDLRPFIPALDFAASIDFYRRLGWSVNEVGAGLALVEASEQHFYVQDFADERIAQNTMLHFTVDDAAAWFDLVSTQIAANPASGARAAAPKREDYGALVTYVHDPAGVLLHFCEWDRT